MERRHQLGPSQHMPVCGGDTSAASTSTGGGNNSSAGSTSDMLASRKNSRQPDVALDLERKVSRRRKTKDDFELDNAPSISSTTASGSSVHGMGTATAGGAASGSGTISGSHSPTTLPVLPATPGSAAFTAGHVQDDMAAAGNGNDSDGAVPMMPLIRPAARSNTISHQERTTRVELTPVLLRASRLTINTGQKAMLVDTAESRYDGDGHLEDTSTSTMHQQQHQQDMIRMEHVHTSPMHDNATLLDGSPIHSTVQPMTVNDCRQQDAISLQTSFLFGMDRQCQKQPTADAGASSTEGASPTSATSLLSTVALPEPLELAQANMQLPPAVHPICSSPTFFGLDHHYYYANDDGLAVNAASPSDNYPYPPIGLFTAASATTSNTASRDTMAQQVASNPYLSNEELLARAVAASAATAAIREPFLREAGRNERHTATTTQLVGSTPMSTDSALSYASVSPNSSISTAPITTVQHNVDTSDRTGDLALRSASNTELDRNAQGLRVVSPTTAPFVSAPAPIDRCPVEVMLAIFAYLPTGTGRHCVTVSKRWHSIASYALYRSPALHSLTAFERWVNTITGSGSGDGSNGSEASDAERAYASTAVSVRSHYAQLVTRLDLARMDEQHRCASGLSRLLTRAAPFLCPTLRELDLGFCKGARNYDLQRLVPLLANLTYLNLSGGGRTDIVISKLAKHCPGLQRLSVAWNASVSDFGCAEIARSCARLRSLDLTCCGGITDAGVVAIIDGCRDLRILGVAYCNGVGDVAVREAVQRLPRLRWLGVTGCSSVTFACVRDCNDRYPGLVVVRPGILPLEQDLH